MKLRLGLILFLLGMFPLVVQAQGGGWAPPHKLETATRSNWFPSVAVDPRGDVHVLWSSGSGDGETANDLLMYASAQNGQWRPGNDILVTGQGGWAARNSLAIDRSGRLHVLVRNRDAIYYTSAASENAWSAQSWQQLRRINGLGQPYYSTIAIDAAGTIHAAWEELSPKPTEGTCQGCSDIWYRQSTDGGTLWSAPVNLSNSSSGSIKPRFVNVAGGAMYLIWDEGKDPNAVDGRAVGYAFTVSRDGGATWAKPVRQSLADDAAQQAALAVDGSETQLLVFRATAADTMLFRTLRRGEQAWSAPAALPGLLARDINETPWDAYSLATDSAGNVHLAAVGRTSPSQAAPALYHMVWSMSLQAWQTPELVSNTDFPEWPQLVTARGNQLHLTWFTRSLKDQHDSDHAAYQVWYSTRTVDAPALVPEVMPTPTSRPTSTPLPPAPTAEPAMPLSQAQREAALPVSPRTEVPLIRSLALSILPAGALCLIALTIVIRRRFM